MKKYSALVLLGLLSVNTSLADTLDFKVLKSVSSLVSNLEYSTEDITELVGLIGNLHSGDTSGLPSPIIPSLSIDNTRSGVSEFDLWDTKDSADTLFEKVRSSIYTVEAVRSRSESDYDFIRHSDYMKVLDALELIARAEASSQKEQRQGMQLVMWRKLLKTKAYLDYKNFATANPSALAGLENVKSTLSNLTSEEINKWNEELTFIFNSSADAPPLEKIKLLNEKRRQLLQKGFHERLCIISDGGTNYCELLEEFKEARSTIDGLLSSLKKDLSLLRRISYVFSRLVNEGETCASPDHWSKFELLPECLDSISTLIQTNPDIIANTGLIYDQLVGPVFDLEEELQNEILRKTGCESIDNCTNKILLQLSNTMGLSINEILIPGDHSSKIAELKLISQRVLEFLKREHSLVKQENLELILTTKKDNVEEADSEKFKFIFHVIQRNTESDREYSTGISLHILADKADLSKLLYLFGQTQTKISEFSSLLNSNGLETKTIVDKDIFIAYLNRINGNFIASFFSNIDEFELDKLTVLPNVLDISMPWVTARSQNAILCRLSIEHLIDATVFVDCIKRKIENYIASNVSVALEELAVLESSIKSTMGDSIEAAFASVSTSDVTFSNEGLVIRPTTLLPLNVLIDWEGKLKLDLNGDGASVFFKEYLLKTVISDIPFIRIENLQQNGDSISGEVFWAPVENAASNIGQVEVVSNDVMFDVDDQKVALPGIGEIHIDKLEYSKQDNIFTLELDSIMLLGKHKIGGINIILQRESKSFQLQISDRAALLGGLTLMLNDLGLDQVGLSEFSISGANNLQFRLKASGLPVSGILVNLDNDIEKTILQAVAGIAKKKSMPILERLLLMAQSELNKFKIGGLSVASDCSSFESIEDMNCTVSITDSRKANPVACSLLELAISGDSIQIIGDNSMCLNSWISTSFRSTLNSDDFRVSSSPSVDRNNQFIELGTVLEFSGKRIAVPAKIELSTGNLAVDEKFIRTNLQKELFIRLQTGIKKVCTEFIDKIESSGGFEGIVLDKNNAETDCNSFASTKSINDELKFGLLLKQGKRSLSVNGLLIHPFKLEVDFSQAEIDTNVLQKYVNSVLSADLPIRVTKGLQSEEGIGVHAVVKFSGIPTIGSFDLDLRVSLDNSGIAVDLRDSQIREIVVKKLTSKLTWPRKYSISTVAKADLQRPIPHDDSDVIKFPFVLELKLNGETKNISESIGYNLKTGKVSLPSLDDVLITDILKEAADKYLKDQEFGPVSLGEPVFKGCELKKISGCSMYIPLKIESEGFGSGMGNLSLMNLVVTIDKNGTPIASLDFPKQIRLPIPDFEIAPVSFTQNSALLAPEFLDLNSSITFARLQGILKIAANAKLNYKPPEIEIVGNAVLLNFLPVGETISRVKKDSISSSVHIGGMLKKILSVDSCLFLGENECIKIMNKMDLDIDYEKDCKSSNNDNNSSVLGCGKGHLFQLAEAKFTAELTEDLRAKLEAQLNLILFKNMVQFNSEPKLQNPSLTSRMSVELGGVLMAGVWAEIGNSGATFTANALGLSVSVVLQNLHNMKDDKGKIEELLLRLLLPDLDILALLEAILSGNITINPFSSFGPSSGDSQGDGGDGSDGTDGNSETPSGDGFGESEIESKARDQLVTNQVTGTGAIGQFVDRKGGEILQSIIEGEFKGDVEISTTLSDPQPLTDYGDTTLLIQESSTSGFYNLVSSKDNNVISLVAAEFVDATNENDLKPKFSVLFNLPSDYLFILDENKDIRYISSEFKESPPKLDNSLFINKELFTSSALNINPLSNIKRQTLENVLGFWRSCLSGITKENLEVCEGSLPLFEEDKGVALLILGKKNKRGKAFVLEDDGSGRLYPKNVSIHSKGEVEITHCSSLDELKWLADNEISRIDYVNSLYGDPLIFDEVTDNTYRLIDCDNKKVKLLNISSMQKEYLENDTNETSQLAEDIRAIALKDISFELRGPSDDGRVIISTEDAFYFTTILDSHRDLLTVDFKSLKNSLLYEGFCKNMAVNECGRRFVEIWSDDTLNRVQKKDKLRLNTDPESGLEKLSKVERQASAGKLSTLHIPIPQLDHRQTESFIFSEPNSGLVSFKTFGGSGDSDLTVYRLRVNDMGKLQRDQLCHERSSNTEDECLNIALKGSKLEVEIFGYKDSGTKDVTLNVIVHR